jgi:uncharacterized protein with PIN domain
MDRLREDSVLSQNTIDRQRNRQKNALSQENSGDKNRIDKVEIQSESRALVWTSEWAVPDQENPDVTQYILTRGKGGWVIEDILERCIICKGTGQEVDSEQVIQDVQRGVYGTRPMKKCTYCKGRGWRSKFSE